MSIRKSFAQFVFLGLLAAAPVFAQAQPATLGGFPGPIGAQSQPQASTTAAAAAPAEAPPAGYVLGAEDVVDVEILGRPDFRTRARVDADGTVLLPLIGRIPATDRTARVLSDEITAALKSGGFFASPIVNVEITSFASRYVTVLGAVGSPGLITVNRPYRLSEILARVGGVRSDGADYLIVRPAEGPEKRIAVRALATGDATQDPFVTPGDKVFIPAADLFYISGQVNTPGPYPLRSDMTVGIAIAQAGGVTASGSDRRVQVTRGASKVKVDLGSKVEAGDVIVIGERLF